MKKSPKQLIAIAALAAIVLFIAAFVISAFTADSGEAGNRFMALLFCIVAVPILACCSAAGMDSFVLRWKAAE